MNFKKRLDLAKKTFKKEKVKREKEIKKETYFKQEIDETISCPRCDGDPEAILDDYPCSFCGGTGKVKSRECTFHPDYEE